MVSHARESSPRPLKYTLILWLVLLGVLAGTFAATVLILNATLYSAGGFVGSYLGALQRHDVDGALATPGVLGAANASDELLTPDAVEAPEDIRQLSDIDLGGGLHVVTYEYSFDGMVAQSTFRVEYTGPRLGLFSTWEFAESPVSILQVLPLHDAAFEVNGITVVSDAGPSATGDYQVLTPGVFTLTHESAYLTAERVRVGVTQGSTVKPVTIDIQANSDFVEKIQDEVDRFLDDCTESTVLFPTACPFGQELSNRVESVPVWSIAQSPVITIEPGDDRGTWIVPGVPGAAHLTVDVRSLFDGTLSTFDEDVPFTLNWVITFDGGRVDIQAG